MTTLRYRPVHPSDAPALTDMRRACGWFEDKVAEYVEPEGRYVMYMFFFNGAGEEVPVGMGGYLLEDEDSFVANREAGVVQVSSLFLYKRFQGSGLGSQILSIIEALATELQKAKTLSLTAIAFDDERAADGPKSKTARWYEGKGYRECKPMEKLYGEDENGQPLIYERFYQKEALSSEETRRVAAQLGMGS